MFSHLMLQGSSAVVSLVKAIKNNFGEFHDAVKDYISSQTVVQEPSADNAYNERAELSFLDFVYQQDECNFQVKIT